MEKIRVVLTEHAVARILVREVEEGVVGLTMPPDEVLAFLSNQVYVETTQYPIIGKRFSPRTTYWVFYSPSDNGYFVAIGMRNRKTHNHEIHTVIPVNKMGKWMLDYSKTSRAKTLACKEIGFVPMGFEKEFDRQKSNKVPSTIKISCMHSTGGIAHVKGLFNVPVTEYHDAIDELIASNGFMEKCFEAAKDKGIVKQDMVSILVRIGSNAQPVILEV